MKPPSSAARARAAAESQAEEIWLLGQPPLQTYLDFVEEMGTARPAPARAALVDEWRAANDHYGELEEAEGGYHPVGQPAAAHNGHHRAVVSQFQISR